MSDLRLNPGNLVIVADKGIAQSLRQLAMIVRYMGRGHRVQIRKWYDGGRRWSRPKTVPLACIVEGAPDTAATSRARDAGPPLGVQVWEWDGWEERPLVSVASEVVRLRRRQSRSVLARAARPLREREAEAQPGAVTCPECGNEQGDMGRNVRCEACGYAPMPYCEEDDDA